MTSATSALPPAPSDGIAFESPAGRWVLAVAVLGSGLASLDGTGVNVAVAGHAIDAKGRGFEARRPL